jgi:hypothetical protein
MLGLGLSLLTGGSLRPYYAVVAAAFKDRVEADGGTVESMSCLKADLKVLNPIKPVPSAFDEDYQAILDEASSLGYTAPSAAQQTLQNTLVTDLKTAGVWDKLDLFYVFATDGDSDYATLNWKTPASFQPTKINSPTFTTNGGFTGDGLSSFLATNYTPSVDAVNVTSTSMSAGGYEKIFPTSTYGSIIGVDSGSNDVLTSSKFAGDSFYRINDGQTWRPHNNLGAGFYGLTRSGANSVAVIGPDDIIHTNNNPVASGMPADQLTILRWAGAVYSNAQLSVAFFGADVTSELSDFKTAVDNYIAGL